MSKLTIYSASAGSGKTYTLTEEYLKVVIQQPQHYKNVMAVTFTNKATEEMKQRIVEKLSELANGEDCDHLSALIKYTNYSEEEIQLKAQEVLNNILHNYSIFGVSTIDSFFQRIIRSFLKDLNISGNFNIELSQNKVLDKVVDQLFNKIGQDEQVTNWILDYVQKRVEGAKSWNVRQNLRKFAKNILDEEFKIVGSDDYVSKDIDTLKVCVEQLEGYNKDFIEQLRLLGSKALAIIHEHGYRVDDFSNNYRGVAGYFVKLNEEKDFMPTATVQKAVLDAEKWVAKKNPERDAILLLVQNQLQDHLKSILDYVKENEEAYFTNKMILDNIYVFGVYNDLIKELKNYRDQQEVLLLSDITEMLNGIIGNNHAPFIYERVGNHYYHYLIDEFQDTSKLQWLNFKPLIDNSLAQGNSNLIVGDVKQAIYRWRGGDWRLLLKDVEAELGSEYVQRIPLDKNYRSQKKVVQFNNAVFQQGINILSQCFEESFIRHSEEVFNGDKVEQYKLIKSFLEGNFDLAYNDVAQEVTKPGDHGAVKMKFYEQDKEVDYWDQIKKDLIQQVDDLLDKGYKKNDIAVLVRKGEEAEKVAQYFSELNKEYPNKYLFVSSNSFRLKDNHHIKVLVCALRYLIHFDDDVNFYDLIYYYQLIKGLDKDLFKPNFIKDLRKQGKYGDYVPVRFIEERIYLSKLPIYELCERLIEIFDLSADKEVWPFLQTFQDYVLSFNRSNNPDIHSLIEWWEESGADKSPMITEDQDAIQIMTVHKSKGLQFKQVLIPFCYWELHHNPILANTVWAHTEQEPYSQFPFLPLPFSKKLAKSVYSLDYFIEAQQVALESLNILYVALTRAEEGLSIFAPLPKESKKPKNLENIFVHELLYMNFQHNQFELHEHFDLEAGVFEYGEIEEAVSKDKKTNHTYELEHYPNSNFRDKIVISRMSDNLFLENTEQKILIDYGNMMHEILSNIRYESDVDKALERFHQEGKITDEDLDQLQGKIYSFFEISLFKEWFSDDNEVLLEHTILIPNQKHDRRPDRIVIKDDVVTVIDFKFGSNQSLEHIKQVKYYQKVIAQMGYKQVKGYLFYGDGLDIVDVDEQDVNEQGSLF